MVPLHSGLDRDAFPSHLDVAKQGCRCLSSGARYPSIRIFHPLVSSSLLLLGSKATLPVFNNFLVFSPTKVKRFLATRATYKVLADAAQTEGLHELSSFTIGTTSFPFFKKKLFIKFT